MKYDKESNILRASPACLSKDITDFLEPLGLWIPGGHCPDVALGGFLSQGESMLSTFSLFINDFTNLKGGVASCGEIMG